MAAPLALDNGDDIVTTCTKAIVSWQRYQKKSPRYLTVVERCPQITQTAPLSGLMQCWEPLRQTHLRYSAFLVEFKKLVKKAKAGRGSSELTAQHDAGDIHFRDLFARIDLYYAAMGRDGHLPAPFPKGGEKLPCLYNATEHSQYLLPSNRLCIVCGATADFCEGMGSSMPAGVERTAKQHQYLKDLPPHPTGQCSKDNLRQYGLVAELYFMGCGLGTHDVRAFVAWAEENNIVKHFSKQEKVLTILADEFIKDMREQRPMGMYEAMINAKKVVQLVVTCNFGQLTHSELCFLECAIRFTGMAKRKAFWDLMYEAVAKLIVLNVQVLDRGHWCMEACKRDLFQMPPGGPTDCLQRHMLASLQMG